MNIKGLDYNTSRTQLIMPEYGREIQEMVERCVALPDRNKRLRCAKAIVAVMGRMHPQNKNKNRKEWEQRLWNHLAVLSKFSLDIDWPLDVSRAKAFTRQPDKLNYPGTKIPVRHYGNILFQIFDVLRNMPPGKERDMLVRYTANQMKRNLVQWGQGSSDNEKVAADLSYFTDGKIQLDLKTFKFAKVQLKESTPNKRKRK